MQARIGAEVAEAARALRAGQVVAVPTETVYGLAANAFDDAAVLEVFRVKQRPSFDPLIVHIGRREDVARLARTLPPGVEAMMDAFWPGPLTLVLPKQAAVPDLVTSGLDTVGIRMPAHPVAQALLQELEFPLAAPSANPFGYISPTTAQHVADQLGGSIPYILDGGPCAVGIESTIIGWDASTARWQLYRAGGLPCEAIEAVIGGIAETQDRVLPVAPGMLESHYAPGKPLHVGDISALLGTFEGRRVGAITFQEPVDALQVEVLSAAGDLAEAARGLFAALRRLDNGACEVILAEVFPQHGLGFAINDRLRRAAVKRA